MSAQSRGSWRSTPEQDKKQIIVLKLHNSVFESAIFDEMSMDVDRILIKFLGDFSMTLAKERFYENEHAS